VSQTNDKRPASSGANGSQPFRLVGGSGSPEGGEGGRGRERGRGRELAPPGEIGARETQRSCRQVNGSDLSKLLEVVTRSQPLCERAARCAAVRGKGRKGRKGWGRGGRGRWGRRGSGREGTVGAEE